MVTENRDTDTIKQLYRRINVIAYHWKDEDGHHHRFDLPMSNYTNYEHLQELAYHNDGFVPVSSCTIFS